MSHPIKVRSISLFEDIRIETENDEPKVTLTEPIFNIVVPFLPTQFSFGLLAAVSDLDINTDYFIEILIINEETNDVIKTIDWDVDYSKGNPSQVAGLITNIKNIVINNAGRSYRTTL